MDLPVAEYAPDAPPLSAGYTRNVQNVLPETAASYGPAASLQPVTDALGARCQGAASMRATDGSAKTFAGTIDKLYFAADTAWTDATGGTTPNTGAEDFWNFAKFGDIAIAVNGQAAVQKFNIASDSAFSDLGGSPPVGKYIAVWGSYVVLANLSTANNKLQWSGTEDEESWTVGTGNSDERTFPDSGAIVGLTGGRQKCVFLEGAIWRATEVGGTDIFQLQEISSERGCAAQGSVAVYQDLVFFLARDGFFMLSDAGLRAIGFGRVDRTFWSDVNKDFLTRIIATCDPTRTLYRIAYPSNESGDGACDKMLVYNWGADRWSICDYSIEYLFKAVVNTGVTLEDLDTLYPSGIDSIPISMDSPGFSSTAELALAAFGTDHKLGFFDGAALAATIDSIEGQLLAGTKAKVHRAQPLVDGGATSDIMVSLGVRDNKLNDSQRFTAAVTQRERGHCPFAARRTKGRYHMARTSIATGAVWSNFQGVGIDAGPAGAR